MEARGGRTLLLTRLGAGAAWGLLAAAVVVTAFVLSGLVLDRWRVVPVLSGSMEPAIPTGAVALTTPIPSEALAEGDVIVFHAPRPGAPVVMHRVVEVVEPGNRPVVRTAGDANPAPDPWAARLEEDRVWKVRSSVPLVGHLVVVARHTALRVGALALATTGLLMAALARIWLGRTTEAPVGRPTVA